MITIEYIAEHSESMNDQDAFEYGAFVAQLNEPDALLIVSNSLAIDSVRAAIKERYIKKDSVVFLFNGQHISPDEHGRLAYWPTGFCDYWDRLLSKLI